MAKKKLFDYTEDDVNKALDALKEIMKTVLTPSEEKILCDWIG